MNDLPANEAVQLQDGRWLGYAEFGAPDGRPLLFFGGMPGSRLYGKQMHRAASEEGFRVISADLPGHGRSDFKPERTMADTAGDAIELADHLGLDRFHVVGSAGGTPHALACAWRCGSRVAGAALANPVLGRYRRPNDEEPSAPKKLLRRAAQTPWANRAVMTLVAAGARRSPGFILKQMEGAGSDADRAIVARPDVRELVTAAAADAFQQGARGPAQEMALNMEDWGLPLSEISVEVHVFQGEDDPAVSREGIESLAAAIPNTVITYVPGAGAMWLFDRAEVMLQALR